MFVVLELLFILLLTMILYMLHKNELLRKMRMMPHAKVEEYWIGKERREHVRFNKDLNVTYAVEKKTHLRANGKTVDISEGGMKLLLDEKLPKGTILDFLIDLPGSKQAAEVEGEVVWSEEAPSENPMGKRFFHSGIRFTAVKEPVGAHIVDYVHSLASARTT